MGDPILLLCLITTSRVDENANGGCLPVPSLQLTNGIDPGPATPRGRHSVESSPPLPEC